MVTQHQHISLSKHRVFVRSEKFTQASYFRSFLIFEQEKERDRACKAEIKPITSFDNIWLWILWQSENNKE